MKAMLQTIYALALFAVALPMQAQVIYQNVQQASGTYTDNGIPRRDGTTNKLQESVLTIADTTGTIAGFGTGGGLTFHGGGTMTGASGALSLTASGTNQPIELTPSGTGFVNITGTPPRLKLGAGAVGILESSNNLYLDFSAGGHFIFRNGSTGTVFAELFEPVGIATTSTDAFTIANTTDATVPVPVQMSGRIRLRGEALETSGNTSQTVDFFIENLPASAATPTGTLKFGYSLNGAAATYPMTLTSAGFLTTLSSVQAGGGLIAAAGGEIKWNGRASFVSPAAFKYKITDNTGAAGVTIDASTDGTLKVRNFADNADAAITAGAGTFSGAFTTTSATRSGPGAVPITTSLCKVTTTGAADALTLADGVDGQRITIVHDVDGGSFVLTPTTKTGWSTFTSTVVGETISLVFVTTRGWMVTGSYLGAIAP